MNEQIHESQPVTGSHEDKNQNIRSNDLHVESRHITNPITALCSLDLAGTRLLLVGEGPLLRVFEDDLLVGCERLPHDAPIRGIVCRPQAEVATYQDKTRQILVYGGCTLYIFNVLVSRNDGSSKITSVIVRKIRDLAIQDRILTACFKPVHDPAERGPSVPDVTLLTHNNVLLRLPFADNAICGRPHVALPYRLAAGPNILLFSAEILWLSSSLVLVASGTAFGEVLVWSAENGNVTASHSGAALRSSLLCKFVAHEGSVFGVTFSRTEQLSGGEMGPRFIASCSDDRTIRMWDISARQCHDESSDDTQHGTGAINRAQAISDRPMAQIMGHDARIWGLRFLYFMQRNGTYILSHSEDSTAQLWRLDLHSDYSNNNLEHLATFDFHDGKNIWSLEVSKKADGIYTVWSGGADGRLVRAHIDLTEEMQHRRHCAYTVRNIHRQLSVQPSQDSGHLLELSKGRYIFEGLKGEWHIHRQLRSAIPTYPSGVFTGTASFEPRTQQDGDCTMEYLYNERGTFATEQGPSLNASRAYIYRYSERSKEISVWFVKSENPTMPDYLFHVVQIDALADSARFHHSLQSKHHSSVRAEGSHLCAEDMYKANYVFQFVAYEIERWTLDYDVQGPKKKYTTAGTYSRPSSTKCSSTSDLDLVINAPISVDLDAANSKNFWASHSSDSFKSYGWISEDELLATTDQGVLLLASTSKDKRCFQTAQVSMQWSYVAQHDSLRSYSMISTLPDKRLAFLGGRDGFILLYSPSSPHLVSLRKTKTPKISFLSTQLFSSNVSHDRLSNTDGGRVLLFATTLGSRKLFIYTLRADFNIEVELISEERSLDLPQSFLVTCCCVDAASEILILGSRHGSLAIFSWPISGTPRMIESVLDVHGSDTVTAIHFLKNPSTYKSKGDCTTYIMTTGRDGRFAIHRFCHNSSSREPYVSNLEKVHVGWTSFGPNIEGMYINPVTSSFLFWGFRSKHFVIWNESSKQEIMKVDCGGCHRSWSFIPSSASSGEGQGGGSFVWTQAGQCMVQRQREASHTVIHPGGHGREIKAVTATHLHPKDGSGGRRGIIATGAEDTNIRLFELCEDDHPKYTVTSPSNSLKCLGIFKQHSAGIQQLRWSQDGAFLFSAAGSEELYIWKVSNIPGFGVGMVVVAQAPMVTTSKELRVMALDVLETIRNSPTNEVVGDGEEREARRMQIVLAYSDGTFRIFKVSFLGVATKTKLSLLQQGSYHQRCLTQIQHVVFNDERQYILTAATDGNIGFYPFHANSRPQSSSSDSKPSDDPPSPSSSPEPLKLSQTYRIHQNTIHCLHTIRLSAQRTLVATSGDDGAVGFTVVSAICSSPPSAEVSFPSQLWGDSPESNEYTTENGDKGGGGGAAMQVPTTLLLPKAHAAAVTGLAYLGRLRLPSPSGPHLCSSFAGASAITADGDDNVNSANSNIVHEEKDREGLTDDDDDDDDDGNSDEQQQQHIFATVGADQVLKLWGVRVTFSLPPLPPPPPSHHPLSLDKVKPNNHKNKNITDQNPTATKTSSKTEIKVQKMGTVKTSVGDVSALEYLPLHSRKGETKEKGGWLIVVGVGLEVFLVSTSFFLKKNGDDNNLQGKEIKGEGEWKGER